MTDLGNVLDSIRRNLKPPNDTALARALRVTPAAVSNWRHGLRFPDEETCDRIATLSGRKTFEIIGLVGIARAKTTAQRAVWSKVMQALCLPVAVGFAVAAGSVKAAEITAVSSAENMHYALLRLKRMARPLLGTGKPPRTPKCAKRRARTTRSAGSTSSRY